jgi:hypothetical protein
VSITSIPDCPVHCRCSDELKRLLAERDKWLASDDCYYWTPESQAERDRYRKALEFYADPFRIMDFIGGTYEIKDAWYAKAREALNGKD